MPSNDRSATAGISLALLAAALYGISGAVAAGAFDEVDPTRVTQARSVMAAAVLIPYAWSRGRFGARGHHRWLVALGLNLGFVSVTYYWTIERLGVGPGTTVQFIGPFFVLGWMALVQRRPVAPLAWLAAAFAIAGVFLITEAWALDDLDVVGLATGLVSAGLLASYFLIGEHLGKTLSAVTTIAWGFLYASVFWILVLPVWDFPTDLSGRVWAELIWVGVGGTALAFITQFGALRRVASGIAGVVATSEPVIAAAAGWILLDQSLTPLQMIGGLVVALAVASVHFWRLAETDRPLDLVA